MFDVSVSVLFWSLPPALSGFSRRYLPSVNHRPLFRPTRRAFPNVGVYQPYLSRSERASLHILHRDHYRLTEAELLAEANDLFRGFIGDKPWIFRVPE